MRQDTKKEYIDAGVYKRTFPTQVDFKIGIDESDVESPHLSGGLSGTVRVLWSRALENTYFMIHKHQEDCIELKRVIKSTADWSELKLSSFYFRDSVGNVFLLTRVGVDIIF